MEANKVVQLQTQTYQEHLELAYARRVNVLKYKVSNQIGLIQDKLQKYILPFLDAQNTLAHNLELNAIQKQNEQKDELIRQITRHHKAVLDQISQQTEEMQQKLQKRKEEAKQLGIQIEQYK